MIYSKDQAKKEIESKETKEERRKRLNREKTKRQCEKNKLLNKTDPIDPTGKVRICKTCKEEKQLTDFPYDCAKRPPYGIYCNVCKNTKARNNAKQYENLDLNKVTKVCYSSKGSPYCGKTKPLIQFTKSAGGKYGRSNQCKDCRIIDRRLRLNKNPITKGMVYCTGHKVYHDASEFSKNQYSSKTGLQSVCKAIQKIRSQKSYAKLPNYIRKILNDCVQRCKLPKNIKRSIKCHIDNEVILELYEEQSAKCAITGIEFTHNTINDGECNNTDDTNCHIKNPFNISIDRINPNESYTKDNIQLVCACVNKIKWDWDEGDLYSICADIYNYQRYLDVSKICKMKKTNIDLPLELPPIDENRLQKYIKTKFTYTKNNAKSRNIDVKITENDVLEQFKKQNQICVFTGRLLTYSADKPFTNFSIDRIDSKLGYIKGNIQLISHKLNNMKSDLPDKKFIEYCIKIRNGLSGKYLRICTKNDLFSYNNKNK